MRKRFPAGLVALCLGLLVCRAAAAPAPVGEVLAFSGQCFLEAGGQKTPLKLGDGVHVGDTVSVADGAKIKLRMSDGSVIAAASGSRLTIAAYDADPTARRDAKLALASGLLRAVVASVGQPSHFEVDTATGVAAVRSTDWFIEARPEGTQVGVLAGEVRLTSTATQHTVAIPARWGARVEPGRDPVPPRVWRQSEFDADIARTDVK